MHRVAIHDEFSDQVAAVERDIDAMQTLKHLLAIITDPAAYKKRIAEEEKLLKAIAAAREQLAQERLAHRDRVERDLIALSRRTAA